MARSVSFATELVSACHYIPRIAESEVPAYFYSGKDIARFQAIWKSILQRMKEKKMEKSGSKRSRGKTADDEQKACHCSKRRKLSAADKQNHGNVQVVRTVSHIDQLDSR